MIIGICGFIGSGKDTVADYLVEHHGYTRDSFAATLKDAVATIFSWDRELLEGRTKEAREWREQVDPWWANRLNIPNLTPRLVLQLWGTEVCRRGFHDDIWIASLENKWRTSTGDIVITDCRFPNEIKSIKDAGGKIIWVQRGPLPEWYDFAVQDNVQELIKRKVHISETAWIGSEFDYVVHNDGTIAELYSTIKSLV
jgi:hypothetical protein